MSRLVVRRVPDARGSHIEPPLDQTWPDLDKLRWHLAVVLHDNELPTEALEVNKARSTVNGELRAAYQLNASGWSVGALSFGQMWDVINGVEYGVRVARRNMP